MSSYFPRQVTAPDFGTVIGLSDTDVLHPQSQSVSTSTTSLVQENCICNPARGVYGTDSSDSMLNAENSVSEYEVDYNGDNSEGKPLEESVSVSGNEIETGIRNSGDLNIVGVTYCNLCKYTVDQDGELKRRPCEHCQKTHQIYHEEVLLRPPFTDRENLDSHNYGEAGPPVQYLCCKQYNVTGLGTKQERGQFFSKVFCVKLIQLVAIFGWLLLVSLDSSLSSKINRTYNAWLYIPFSIYFLIMATLRFYPMKLPQPKSRVAFLIIILTACAALVLGAAMVKVKSNAITYTVIVLLCCSLFWAMFPRYGMFDVILVVTLVGVTVLMATLITGLLFFLVKLCFDYHETSKLWVPVGIVSNLIILAFVLELKSIIKGRKFDLSYTDWLYVALFL